MAIQESICQLKKQGVKSAPIAKLNIIWPMNKILVVGPSWVGDMMMAQTLFLLLREKHRDLQLDVLAPAWSFPLLERMPEVSTRIASPFNHGQLHLRKRCHFARQLRAQHYDQAIVLPNTFKSALIPWWAKIPKRTGWVGEHRYGLLNDIRQLDEAALPKMVQRFAALAFEKQAAMPDVLPVPTLSVSDALREAALQAHQITLSGKPMLALCPGAEFGSSKQWPTDYYAFVANHYLAVGWDVWIFGSKNDALAAEKIQQKTNGQCVNLAGKTQLAQAIDLLSLATVILTNDSGLMHIAAALDKPLIALYGSTSPDFTPPFSKKAVVMQAKESIACRPCFKRECPLSHHDCMQKLLPLQVIAMIDAI